jgi:hypothetical protein
LTDDNSNLVDMSLSDFSKDFFGEDEPVATETPEAKDDEKNDEVLENEDDALATDEDESSEKQEDTPEDEDEKSEEEEEKPAKKTKKSFQDRIDELTAKARNEERRAAALEKRLAELEARKPEDAQPAPKPLREQLDADAPNPDAKDEDGEPIYKLGEFDPKFIRDLTRHTIEQETKAAKAEAEKTALQQKVEAEQEALKTAWASKVEAAEEDLPDLRDKLTEVEVAFEGIDPQYGEYLAATIMSCDNGPQIMYYLSQNIGEAQKIVASGPSAATLAIGKLDAKFTKPAQEEKRNTKKVSDAAPPPSSRTRGSGGSKTPVAGDTRDLAAFSREFFK